MRRICRASLIWAAFEIVAFEIVTIGPLLAQGSPPAPTASPVPQTLSLAQAMQMAQAHSAPAQGVQARLAGAEARLRAAGAQPNPALSLAHGFGRDAAGLDEDVVLAQTLEPGAKRRPRVQAARAERDAALAERTGVMSDLELAVRTAYTEAQRTEVERGLAAAALDVAQAFAKAAEAQFQAGDVARRDVLRSRIELARAESGLAAAATERANRFATLVSLIGLPPDANVTLGDAPAFVPAAYALPDLQKLALQNRTNLQTARLQRAVRQAEANGVRAQKWPDFFAEGRHAMINDPHSGDTLRLGVTFTPFDLGRNRGEHRAAQAAVQEQEATLDEATRVALLEVETAWRTLEQARREVEAFQTGRLDRARELLEMAQKGYKQGASSYLDILDAQQVYRLEQADYARALAAFNIAQANLQHAAGGTLP